MRLLGLRVVRCARVPGVARPGDIVPEIRRSDHGGAGSAPGQPFPAHGGLPWLRPQRPPQWSSQWNGARSRGWFPTSCIVAAS